jgi:two-component system, sensor histidine kinase and response regulator
MRPRPHILVVDDDPAVRRAYRRILQSEASESSLADARAAIFDDQPAAPRFTPELTVVNSGEQAIAAVREARAAARSFSMAFIDMRMPPGMDGIETTLALWEQDPDLQVVIASAYSDTPWSEMVARLGNTDRLVFLNKPFDPIEALQLATALSEKRNLLLDAQLRELELERRVEERTRELSVALLAAEQASRAKLDFLANMSHEIRTPLTAILGFGELLGDRLLSDSERQEQAAIVERNGRHLLALVNDVLDLSKLEARQLLLEMAPVDALELVREAVGMLHATANAKSLRLEFSASGLLPESIRSDATRLRQILLNLIGNALKFTERGEVRVLLSCEQAGDAASALVIQVADTGIGIPRDRLPLLFQPFVQADASMTRRFCGTGLGLSISRQLARLMGGDLTVASQEGEGSKFTLRLPVGDLSGVAMIEPGQHPVRRVHAAAKGEGSTYAQLRGRVLLAEDGLDNQRLLRLILQRAGAEVVLAADGQAALDLVQHSVVEGSPFDLILMDMQMPIMDGYTATRKLRESGWSRPIVALTAHAMDGDRERCLAVGCDGYETKPVRAKRLIDVVSQFLPESQLE